MNPIKPSLRNRRLVALAGVLPLLGTITALAAPPGPDPVPPAEGVLPGAYPNTSVSSVNIIAKGNPEGFDGRVEVTGFEGQGPIPWTVNRYNRGDFAVRLAPANPEAALANLNQGFIDYSVTSTDVEAHHAWRPHPNRGIVIPTARQNGPIDWGDGTPPFYPTIAISQASSGPGFSMLNGSYATGELDINTGRAGVGPNGEGNFAFSATWFPYDQGWIGGEFGNPGPGGVGVWRQPASHATGVTAGMLTWTENPAGSGTYGGSATLRLPGVNSLSDGMLFGSSSEGSSTLNILGVAPLEDGAGWLVTLREDSAADAETLAVATESPFQWVYVPWTADRLVGGYISGADGSSIASKGTFTLARTGVGVYEVAVPGKTASQGTLILQAADLEPETSVPLATRAFLSYEWADGKMVIKSFVTSGETTVDPRDVNFYFAWIDFEAPLAMPSGPRFRNLPAVQVTPSEVDGAPVTFREACVAVNIHEPEVLVTTIDERNIGQHIDPLTGLVATSALIGHFYDPITLAQTRSAFLILANPSGVLNRHDTNYNPVSKQYVVAANARTYGEARRAIPLVALVNPHSIAGENSPLVRSFIYEETTAIDFDDIAVAVSSKNGNFILACEYKFAGEGEGAVAALFDKDGNLLTPQFGRLDLLQSTGDEDDPDVVYLPLKDAFLYTSNTDLNPGLRNRVVGALIDTTPSPAGELITRTEQVLADGIPEGIAEGHPASLENPFNGQIVTAFDTGGNDVPSGDVSFYTIESAPGYAFTAAREDIAYLSGTGGDPFRHNHPQLDADPKNGIIVIGIGGRASTVGNPNAYTFQVLNADGDLMPAPFAAPFFLADAPGGNSTSVNFQNIKYSPQSESFLAVYNTTPGVTYLTALIATSSHLPTPARPSLTISRTGADVVIRWPASAAGFALESTGSLAPANWSPVTTAPSDEGANKRVQVPAAGGARYYRLVQ